MNVLKLRDQVRAYLAAQERDQKLLADEIGVSYSWLNKFRRGGFPNFGLVRLHQLHEWMQRDRKRPKAAA